MDQNTEVQEKIIHQGKWLIFKQLLYKIKGKDQIWEMLERPNSRGGVVLIPILKKNEFQTQLILIANYRIPIRQFSLEFPGGLIEEGNPALNGIRELKEETGYTGKIFEHPLTQQRITLDPWKNRGFSFANCAIIDGDLSENQNLSQELDEAELIKVHLVDLDENLCDSIKKLADENNYSISSEVLTFSMGFCASKIMSS